MRIEREDLSKGMKHMEELLEQALGELKRVGNYDSLTGAYNRVYFDRELERIEEEDINDVSLLLVDINGMKSVNDVFGRARGDDVLVALACLLECACEESTVCRIGDDRFAVLLHDTGPGKAEFTSAMIRKACEDGVFCCDIPHSISCGVAYRPNDEIGATTFYRLAENSLLHNKLNDRNCVEGKMVHSLQETMHERHPETTEHLRRMEKMATFLSNRLPIGNNDADRLILLSSMHDIGKVAIPDHIINKTERLDETERNIMNGHSESGYRIALATPGLSCIASEILHHHEWWNGGGYPDGIGGSEIPELSRIVSVLDAYDVMTHQRAYKKPCSHKEAVRELQKGSGGQFAPEAVALFLNAFAHEEHQIVA